MRDRASVREMCATVNTDETGPELVDGRRLVVDVDQTDSRRHLKPSEAHNIMSTLYYVYKAYSRRFN